MLLGDYFFTDAQRGIIFNAVNTINLHTIDSGVTFNLTKNSSVTNVYIYQGTIPTSSAMDNFAGGSRDADALLKFTTTVTVTGTNINFRGQFACNALGVGTASWFCIGALTEASANKALLFGTIGLAGSNADLILSKVSVVTNDIWACNITLKLNNVYTQGS